MRSIIRVVTASVALIAFASWAQTPTAGAAPMSSSPASAAPAPSQPAMPAPRRVDDSGQGGFRESEKWGDLRGVTVMAGGGAEGFTSALAPRLRAGPSWAASVVFKPTSVWGIEVGYTGSYHQFVTSRLAGYDPALGANVVRHGGHVAVSFGLTATRVQPYLLAGIGINKYLVTGAQAGGYNDATVGTIPLGGGLRVIFPGRFTLDLRATYNFELVDQLVAGVTTAEGLAPTAVRDSGRWRGTLYLGYTF